VIFEGTPDEVKASPIVQAAYLGTGDAELLEGEESVSLGTID